MDDGELAHLREMLDTHTQRLYKLELKEAMQGNNTPAEILIELENVRKKIIHCQSKIDALSQANEVSSVGSQVQAGDRSNTGRIQVEITFDGRFDDLSPEIQMAVVRAIAGIVEIPTDQVTVQKIMPGSVIVVIELPAEAAYTLLKLYETGNEIIKELDIQKIRLTSKQVMPLSKLVENAAVEQEEYLQHRESDTNFTYEILHRALVEKNELALKELKDLHSNLVQRWIQRWQDIHKSEFENAEYKAIDELVDSVFERLMTGLSSPGKLGIVKNLASFLNYLKLSVNGVMADYVRRLRQLSFEEFASEMKESDDNVEYEGMLKSDEFWALINRKAEDPKEYLAIHASFYLKLSPKEILEQNPDRFASVREIYEVKARFLERLEEDSEILAYINQRGSEK